MRGPARPRAEAGALSLVGGTIIYGGSGGAASYGPGGASATVGGTNGIPSVTVDSNGNVRTNLNTSPQATQGRIQSGAQATLDLAQNGYDPSKPADNQKLVQSISGGLATAGLLLGAPADPAGDVLVAAAAVVEAMYTVGEAIASGLCKLGIFDCREYCNSSGNWTAANFTPPPGLAQGSPQAALWPQVASSMASYANCKPNIALDTLYQGFQAIWNKCFDGSSTVTFAVYDPQVVDLNNGEMFQTDPFWGAVEGTSAGVGAAERFVDEYGHDSVSPLNDAMTKFSWLTVNAGPMTAFGQQAMRGYAGPIRMQGGPVFGGTFAGAGQGVKVSTVTPSSPSSGAGLVIAGAAALAAWQLGWLAL